MSSVSRYIRTSPGLRLVTVLLYIGLAAEVLHADTHYVVPPDTPGVTPLYPYSSWNTAGTSVLDVVNAALDAPYPRMVWVTNGVYKFTNRVDINQPVTIKSVNGWKDTVLDGNALAYTASAITVNISSGSERGIIDGFTITNFIFSGSGSCVVLLNNRGIVQNCLIAGNRSGGINDGSGAVYIRTYSMVSNCVFRGNTAKNGGGVYMSYTQPYLVDCLIEENQAYYRGGGIFVNGKGTATQPIIERVTVANNHAQECGGIYVNPAYNEITIKDCTVTGNRSTKASGAGGGLFISSPQQYPVSILDTVLQGNESVSQGGGIFSDNTTEVTIRNSLIVENTAANEYGGIHIGKGSVESCTIAMNQSEIAGGGLALDGAFVTVRNTISYHNSAPQAPNYTNLNQEAVSGVIEYSCVWPAISGTGNIYADPNFVNHPDGNYRLRGNSPCIDAGIFSEWMADASDLDGKKRVVRNVDMGAFETHSAGSFIILR